MTALGAHEHFQCDQCKTQIRVKTGDLVSAEAGPFPLRPRGWIVIDISGGSRLQNIVHLCGTCSGSLDRHFFGPNGCDSPKVADLERLLKRAREALLPGAYKEIQEFIADDIDGYFNPGIEVER